MASPYGLAYGLGAGFSGIPMAAVKGLGYGQQLQHEEMANEQMAQAMAEEEAMNRAVREGASSGLGYSEVASRAAQLGAGAKGVTGLMQLGEKQKVMQREQWLDEASRAIAFGHKPFALDRFAKLGVPIKDFDITEDGQNITVYPTEDRNNKITMPVTDAVAFIREGKSMPNLLSLADKQAKAEREAKIKEGAAAEKKRMNDYKINVYDQELFKRWSKMGAAGGSGSIPAKLQIYNKFYNEARQSGLSHEEADRAAWERAGGGVTERSGKLLEGRMLLAERNMKLKSLVEMGEPQSVKDKAEYSKLSSEIKALEDRITGVFPGGGGAAPKPTAPKPGGNIKWD